MMNWRSLLNCKRLFSSTTPSDDEMRTPFHVDYDRVVFSQAFRRLARKTQVHPLAKKDHVHNRLTHSIEVASVGRSLGNQVGYRLQKSGKLPSDVSPHTLGQVVQVACLAHDLGNPPFGHVGECAIRDWFAQPQIKSQFKELVQKGLLKRKECQDLMHYEGNAHSLRTVLHLEMSGRPGGMRLTAASIGALMKYPWISTYTSEKSEKFGIYQTEWPVVQEVAKMLGLPEKESGKFARHPLSYLMEAADDICYAFVDLEDAAHIGILSVHDIQENVIGDLVSVPDDVSRDTDAYLAILRSKAIGLAIEAVADAFVNQHEAILSGDFGHHDLLCVTEEKVATMLKEAKTLARKRVFRHPKKITIEIAVFPCLSSILDTIMPAVTAYIKNRSTGLGIGQRAQSALELLGKEHRPVEDDSPYEAYMKVLDFIGQLTDNSAAQLARDISGLYIN